MKNFTRVPNALITDARLSLGARMVYIYIASKPNNWEFHPDAMAHELGITRGKMYQLLQELEAHNVLKRQQTRDHKTRFGAASYELAEYRKAEFGKSEVGKAEFGKSAHLVRLNNSKTDINKTECERGDKSPAHTLDYFIQQTKAAQAALKAEGMKADRVVVMKFHNYWTQVMDDGRMLWETKPFDFTNRLRNWLMGEYATV